MEKWQQVKEDNIHLATIRVYEKDPVTRKQRIFLSMPAGQGEDGEQYELEMQHEVVENQIVVAEREKTPGSRARTSILTGRIKHDCSLRPSFTKSYLQRLRERNMAYNTPTRRTKMFDPDEHGGRGRQNMLNSGAGDSSTFADMVVSCSRRSTPSIEFHSLYRRRRRNPPRANSCAMRVCQETSCWTLCSVSTARRHAGRCVS